MKLIVEMEMPIGCSWVEKGIEKRCPMAGIDHYLQIRCRVQSGRIVHAINKSGGVDRPSWCPIKGALPEEHGDLIDRDVLYMAVKSHNTSDAAIARNHNRVTSLQNLSTIRKGYIAEKHICLDDIIRAEAVIKAERKDDEQADC